MHRILIVLFAVIGMLSVAPATFAADAPGNPAEGVEAPKVVADKATKSLNVWAGRVGRHDNRALEITDDAKMALFGTTDPAMLEEQLKMRLPIEITEIGDVRIRDDGTITVTVSFVGFTSKLGYNTLRFVLLDEGKDYLTIAGAEYLPPVIPEGKTVADISISATAEGGVTLSVPSIEERDFVVLTISNENSRPFVPSLYEVGADRTGLENVIAGMAVMSNSTGELIIAELKAGEYVIVDIAAQGAEVATIIVK